MAQIIPNQQGSGGMIRWDEGDWTGLVPQYEPSSPLSAAEVTTGNGFAFARGVDPFRKPGYIQPGLSGNDATNVSVVSTYMKNIVVNGTTAYGIGGTKLHAITSFDSTPAITNAGSFPHTISDGHANLLGQDVCLYYISGTKYLFYSYYDDTDGNVGRYDLAATFVDNWMSTVPTSGATLTGGKVPHPMIVGDDNILYIADGINVASYNGTSNVFNPSALDLPTNYVITSFAKIKNYLVIYAYRSSAGSSYFRGEATAFFWDYVSDSFTYAYPLDGNYVSGGFSYLGTVGCFVQGRAPKIGDSKTSRLMIFDGTGFIPKFSFKQNIPDFGGVEVAGNVIYFLAGISSGNSVMYQYGSPYIDDSTQLGTSQAKNYITECSGDQSGALKNLGGTVMCASSGATTTGGLQYFSSGYISNSQFICPQVNISSAKFSQARINLIKVYWGPASSTHTFSLNFLTDRGNKTTTVISNLSSISSYVTKYEEDSSGNPLPVFTSIAPNGVWSTTSSTNVPPTIQAIEVYYEYRNV